MSDPLTPNLDPEIFRAVGRLIVGTANFETGLFLALAKLLGDDDAATAILLKIDNISARWAIVSSVADLRPDNPMAIVIKAARSDIDAAFSLRNKLAHNAYGVDEDSGRSILILNATTQRRGRPKLENLDVASIDATSTKLLKAFLAIRDASAGVLIRRQ